MTPDDPALAEAIKAVQGWIDRTTVIRTLPEGLWDHLPRVLAAAHRTQEGHE